MEKYVNLVEQTNMMESNTVDKTHVDNFITWTDTEYNNKVGWQINVFNKRGKDRRFRNIVEEGIGGKSVSVKVEKNVILCFNTDDTKALRIAKKAGFSNPQIKISSESRGGYASPYGNNKFTYNIIQDM